MQNKTREFLQRAALSVLPVAGIALLSSFFTRIGDYWYNTLNMPAFTPPQWAFPVAWGIVYVCLMALLYILLGDPDFPAQKLLLPGALVGALNILWTFTFFGLHEMTAAAFVLLALLVVLICLFFRLIATHKGAAWLLMPHILWGIFAFALNIGFILVN